jgi:hypothetical protein
MKWEEIIYKGTHEPLITVEEYNEVQRIIKRNTKNSKLKRKILAIKLESEDEILNEGVDERKKAEQLA